MMAVAASIKSLIIWPLVILLGFQSALLAKPLDKEKLMLLKPLCSERINKQATDYKNNWPGLLGTFALIGVGLLPTNIGGTIDDNKLGILSVGLVSIIGGALAFSTSGDQVIQNKTFWALELTGTDKELAAYAILKNNEAQSRDNRKGAGIMLFVSGLGVACLTTLATGATQSYKNNMYLGAAANIALGLWTFRNPGADEKEMNAIDKELGVTL